MATLTNLEPLATGTVILKTTRGDIQIELWCKEVPKACRNFIQLCLEGYYDGTIVHRVVPEFLIQGGDPTGTGMGGESIYGEPFAVETHPRLRFIRRGLVGMACTENEGNNSQFFITLGPTPEWNGKQTLFGRVVGDTIYNVVRISELELDANQRPVFPPKIISTEVIDNYFTDIKPRSTKEEREKIANELAHQEKQKERNKLLKSGRRNKAVLSFGDEVDMPIVKKPLRQKTPVSRSSDTTTELSKDLISSSSSIHSTYSSAQTGLTSAKVSSDEYARQVDTLDTKLNSSSKSKVQEEISRLKSELRDLEKSGGSSNSKPVVVRPKKRNILTEELEKYKKSKKVVLGKRKNLENDEESTLRALSSFQSKIRNAEDEDVMDSQYGSKIEDTPCSLHNVPGCFSCFDRLGEKNITETNSNWFAHRLVAENDPTRRTEELRIQRAEELKDVPSARPKKLLMKRDII
ncbi:cyclophilin family peptidyl-prolyl cis-trans isomerase Cyp7 [Schizosaccharomyces pombe]|uniref:Peptidylprolyl isomerase cyp7 n=1 Tax=Schizosaccharomyces pombe (strain 972 / ATCC 24843) TaxID=284812 RepID=CYP7_SCHPO|nr:putative cyclophilin family peptidyl-prolyl cis-trans isomerase Cyp7 [Schizosaccharomyces pombe]O42941.1 RecName: Full=Peptidylprolyl isomerase cyp7; Short=PPIase cyp7; AltName: Full=Complexed with cdc5 protein 27; AltName: Full=Cyclophilin 7; AltName: Full=Rotamase cyp7 [Schizosaccharomyces pombe 972h-]CAA17903.1 cyclophilin family peptidyl-prolyl cis-trans isomerase Cyp7 (predicted) [Schizosaccharomyces pombe]|eukprot:NP_001342715.1 putative cyclophilin family peptidyl-prolyl cis-trans isomerase Cyp7 [Schizosaccharomyces pombe]